MKYPCIESTLEINYLDYRIRLWINEKELPICYDGLFSKMYDLRAKINANINHKMTMREIAEYCAHLPNINAVQIIGNGLKLDYGIMIYTVPFSEKD